MNANLPETMATKYNGLKPVLDSVQKYITTHVKECVGLALLPPPKLKKGQSYPKGRNDVLVVVNLDDKKNPLMEKQKISKLLDAEIKKIDKNLKPFVVETFDIREDCYDGKYTVLEEIMESYILFDPKDLLSAIKVTTLHKNMIMKKFEKYIVAYVCAGSTFRGEKVSHDIDTYVIIDDTDVKRMTRVELRDKLGAIVRQLAKDASYITGLKKPLHLQTYLLTDFWESVKDAHPVIFTFVRDGVPIMDKGVFMPWKLLLKMGRVRPSPEAIDMQMNTGERLVKRAKDTFLTIASADLCFALLNPAQAALMLYGVAPPTHREAIKLLDDIFVKKEKLLEKKYVNMLQKIFDIYKGIEHGKIKSLTGKELDVLLKDAEEYLAALNKLFKKMQKRKNKESLEEMYKNAQDLVSDALKAEGAKKVSKAQLATLFKKNLVDKKKMLKKHLDTFRLINKTKKEYVTKKISPQELEKVRKESRILFKALTELVQRKMGFELDRVKIRFKYGENLGEAMLLDDKVFIIEDLKAKEKEITEGTLGKDGSFKNLVKSDVVKLERHLSKVKVPNQVFVKEKTFESLKKLYGTDVEILIHS